MTDLAKTNEAVDHQSGTFADPQHGKLRIDTKYPSTVYVKAYLNEDGSNISGFGASETGPFFEGGLEWQSNGEYAMFITLTLLPGVLSVDCEDLPYSPTYGSNQNTQNLCILNVAPKKYQFYVNFPDGSRHDPKIVVTPPSLPDPM